MAVRAARCAGPTACSRPRRSPAGSAAGGSVPSGTHAARARTAARCGSARPRATCPRHLSRLHGLRRSSISIALLVVTLRLVRRLRLAGLVGLGLVGLVLGLLGLLALLLLLRVLGIGGVVRVAVAVAVAIARTAVAG